MPRVKIDPRNHKYRDLEERLAGRIKTEGKTCAELCAMFKISHPTLRKYLRRPGTMSLEMLNTLGQNLHIPIEELRNLGIKY